VNDIAIGDYGCVRETVLSWKGRKVLVAGDMILDEYLYGTTDRVSREAPVVIVRYDSSSWCPGGAANAATNIASLGGRAVAVGVTGRDAASEKLNDMLRASGVRTGGLVAAAERMTTSKTRVLAGDFHAQRQQIVRIDRESGGILSPAVTKRFLRSVEKHLPGCGAVILSDYGQGVFSDETAAAVIRMASSAGIPVIADSRFALTRFRGITTATPNEVEAAEAAGIEPGTDDALARTGRKLLKELGSESLLITRGRLGMALFRPRMKTLMAGVVGSPEATDVTGAGDTVVSAVALTLAAGGGMREAMLAANVAASIVVMKRGTAVTEPDEIMGRLESYSETGGGGGS
jgi:rfaE bifunctional protein kinase chain/domain